MFVLLFFLLFSIILFEFIIDLLLVAFIMVAMPIACFLDWYLEIDKKKDEDVQS